MKFITLAVLSFSFSAISAVPCDTKLANAASFTLAQELGVAVQNVQVVKVVSGLWTEAVANNSGSSKITVSAGNRIDRGITFKEYSVAAKQIGVTSDCNVIGVREN